MPEKIAKSNEGKQIIGEKSTSSSKAPSSNSVLVNSNQVINLLNNILEIKFFLMGN